MHSPVDFNFIIVNLVAIQLQGLLGVLTTHEIHKTVVSILSRAVLDDLAALYLSEGTEDL